MQVVNKINKLIADLNNLKPELSDDFQKNEKKFTALLRSNIETNDQLAKSELAVEPYAASKVQNEIPGWVDQDYSYDPQNPRKPNMREMMEALSGKAVEDLYKETDESWEKISRRASDILYGVVGSNEDTRDWLSIMESKDVLAEAREQTGAMYKPEVDIQSNLNQKGTPTEQIAIIKDSKGNTLASLSSNVAFAEETLLNFGATKECIPANLEDQVDPEIFDNDLLTFLKNFDKKPASIKQILVHNASEVIANKISQDIPFEELYKL